MNADRIPWPMRVVALYAAAAQLVGGRHVYLSTGCLHGQHAYCRSQTRRSDGGAKAPARCKFGPHRCICPLCRHPAPAR